MLGFPGSDPTITQSATPSQRNYTALLIRSHGKVANREKCSHLLNDIFIVDRCMYKTGTGAGLKLLQNIFNISKMVQNP